jgi:hypothetical protein
MTRARKKEVERFCALVGQAQSAIISLGIYCPTERLSAKEAPGFESVWESMRSILGQVETRLLPRVKP